VFPQRPKPVNQGFIAMNMNQEITSCLADATPVTHNPDGLWNLCFNDSKSLAGLRSRVMLHGRKPVDIIAGAKITCHTDSRLTLVRSLKDVRIITEFQWDKAHSLLEISVVLEVPKNGKPVLVESVELVSIPLSGLPVPKPAGSRRNKAEKGLCFWRNWHDIWYDIGSKQVGLSGIAPEVSADTAYLAGGVYSGDGEWSLAALYRQPCDWQAAIAVEDGRLVARNLIGATVMPRQPLHSDKLRLAVGLPLTGAMSVLHREHQPRRNACEAKEHFGWNTWEAYHGSINTDTVMKNAAAIAAIPWLRDRIRYITIDDGWERSYGDWYANERFPDGMDDLARRIRDAGFQPGIWTAPFFANSQSETAQLHPDWLLRDGEAPVRDGDRNILDPTHPGVRAFLFSLYQRLRGWGYRYFKTDFLRDPVMYATPLRPEYRPGLRLHDPELGIARGMRAAMQAIRAGIGEDSFWLGCGTDIASGALLMDGSRIGGDIVPYWTRVPYQARSVIHNFHLHGHLFLADPDFLLVKGPDTCLPGMLDVPEDSGVPYEVDAWKGGRANGLAEVRSWASLVILSGGLVNLSDKIGILNEAGLDTIRTVLEYAGGNAAIPIDLSNPIPRVLLRRDGQQCILGLFNWSNDKSVSVFAGRGQGIPFPASGSVHDIWSGDDIRIKNDAITVKLPPRCSRLLKWDAGTNKISAGFLNRNIPD